MQQPNQPLASNVVRKCARCNAPAMVNVSLDDSNQFRCTSCGEAIELWAPKDAILGLAVFGGILSLLLMDDHLFWLLLHLLANPLQELPAMLKDGIFAPVLIPLGLVLINILMVGLPLTGLASILHGVYKSFRNPIVKGAAADVALEGHTFKPDVKRPRVTVHEIFRSLMIAVAIHIGFIAIAWLSLTFASKAAFEGFVEGALPGLLLSGGILFGARRWIIATAWVVLLPVSGFIIAVLMGQLS